MQRILRIYKKRRIYIPLILIAVFIVASRLNHTAVLRFYAVLYLLVIVFARRSFTASPRRVVRRGKKLWIAVALTTAGLLLAHFLERALVRWLMVTFQDDGVIDVTTRETAEYFLYIVVMMFLVPIGEGLLFRGRMILFKNPKETAITTAFTVILCLLIHADGLAGIPVLLLPLIPLTICYLTTRNTILCMILHVFYCIYDNYAFVGYAFARIIYQYN